MNFCVGQFFAFILCTRWYNPAIHRQSGLHIHSFSTTSMGYLNSNSGFLASADDDDHMFRLQQIGSHVMKLLVLCFEILLTMHLAGTPPSARFVPVSVLFIPLFLLQGAGILFSVYRLVETIIVLVNGEAGVPSYFRMSTIIRDTLSFLRHGTRFVGWWSLDEGSREEQARLYFPGTSGYNTFAPPDTVKKMPRAKLAEEIRRLQEALYEHSQSTRSKHEEFERFKNDKILCRVCFDCYINILLLPCRHYILCSACSEKCDKCPICRMIIEERLPILDV